MQEQATTTRCTECRRPLRSAASIARGRGRTCARKARQRALVAAKYANKPHLVAKAEEALEAGVVVLRGRVCLVPGSEGAIYRSHPDGCNCRAGLRNKYLLCHHRIAADIYTAA